jgi:hypothetical protein
VSEEADALAALFAPAPCRGCPLWRRCAIDRLACEAFSVYVTGHGREVWETIERAPTREVYVRIGLGGEEIIRRRGPTRDRRRGRIVRTARSRRRGSKATRCDCDGGSPLTSYRIHSGGDAAPS